jgi:hypothetical protein
MHGLSSSPALGRVPPTKLAIVIPAHFLGCLFATVSFYALCPINYDKVRDSIIFMFILLLTYLYDTHRPISGIGTSSLRIRNYNIRIGGKGCHPYHCVRAGDFGPACLLSIQPDSPILVWNRDHASACHFR